MITTGHDSAACALLKLHVPYLSIPEAAFGLPLHVPIGQPTSRAPSNICIRWAIGQSTTAAIRWHEARHACMHVYVYVCVYERGDRVAIPASQAALTHARAHFHCACTPSTRTHTNGCTRACFRVRVLVQLLHIDARRQCLTECVHPHFRACSGILEKVLYVV